MTIITPDWVPPIETTFDVEKPIRAEQGLMLAGNPIAMANGASGAPRVQPQAISAPFYSFGDIASREFVINPNATHFEVNFVGELFTTDITLTAASYYQPSFAFSTDGGATWGANQQIARLTLHAKMLINLDGLTYTLLGQIGGLVSGDPVLQAVADLDEAITNYSTSANRMRFTSGGYSMVARCIGGKS